MESISKSVGSGGKNVRTDVMKVQTLLIKSARYLPDTGLVLPTGTSDGRTVAAIFEFQRRVGRMAKGDGRVDPGGNTLKLLNDTAIGKNPVPVPAGPTPEPGTGVTVPPAPPALSGLSEPLMEKSCPFAEIGFFDRLLTELFWPIRTTNSRGRLVSYKNVHGKIHGNGSRRFLASRQGGARYHVGIDLYCNHKDIVVACEDGTIVNHYPFYAGTHCLFVQNDSGTVINYGEVEKGSWSEFHLTKGSRVTAGEPIARVGRMTKSSMCHFEMYTAGSKRNQRWKPGQKRPRGLLNPTKYLLMLAKDGK